ncbi:MAG: HipA domain-containing protein [Acidimicrobiales bacterium]
MPSGAAATTHILKPAVAGFEAQHLNEHLCLTAARLLGLSAARTMVETVEDESAVVVERFDRTRRNGAVIRVHQEDLCQALSVAPARKYQADGGPTPAGIAELLRSALPAPDAETDVWRFADALAFNWLIAGTDAHAKNYGLLLAGSDRTRLVERVIDLATRTPEAFATAAGAADGGVADLGSDLPGRLVDLVAERCRRCVAVLH